MRSQTANGAALVLALVILAALLLLGLPFLFSQSSSLTGARYLAAGQAARLYADSARNLGIAAAIYAHEFSMVDDATLGTNTRSGWTAWIPFLNDYPATQPVDQRAVAPIANFSGESRNVVHLQPEALPGDWNQPAANGRARTLVGVSLSDECGKLDANSLGPVAWDVLLKQVLGPAADPDDTQINAADRDAAGYKTGTPPTLYEDGNALGQLAEGFAHQRMQGPFKALDDLLKVEPFIAHGSIKAPNGHRIARRPLTRAELDLLRPYLTVHTLGQAGGGVIELGNVVDNATSKTCLLYTSDAADDM
jgi:type II secretory pathway pseudopilin PulG